MFENTKRTIAAVKKINTNRQNHKRTMKIVRGNENVMLDYIDNAFANIQK